MSKIASRVCLIGSVAFVLLAFGACSPQAKKARRLARADRNFEAGQYQKAEIDYRSVLQIEPANPHAIRQLGFLYNEQGRPIHAFSFLRRAEELEPDNLEVRLKLGTACLGARRFKEARDEARFILAKQPADEGALVLLAEATSTPAEIEEVRKFLETLRPQIENTTGFHLASGALSLRQQDFKAAEAAFKRALALDSKSSAAQVALGTLFWAQNDLNQANQAFKTAAGLVSFRSPRRLTYADFKVRTGDAEAGRRILEEMTVQAPDYLPAWIRLAELAFAEKKQDECGARVKTILARDANNFDALMLRGRLKLAQGEGAGAVAEFERLNTVYPRVPQVYYQLAVAHLLKQETAEAVNQLNQALKLDPNFVEGALLLAELNLRRGDVRSAVVALEELIRQRPKLAPAHLLLANAYYAGGNLDEAAGTYRRLMELYPRNPQVPLLMGSVLLQQGKRTEARDAFEKALEVAPDYSPALEQLVDLDIADQKPSDALARVQQQIAKVPRAAELQLLLGKIHLAQRDLGRAETELLKAIELNPDLRSAYLLLVNIYIASHKHEQALQRLQGVLAANPKDTIALMQVGTIYNETTNYVAARDAYEKLLTVNPRFSPALNNLAYLYSEHLDQLGKAYEMARRARGILPNDPFTADTLGWILYKRREYPWALSLLQESADKLPTEAEVLFHLGMTHYMMGEEGPARNALQRSLRSSKDFPDREEGARRLAVLNIDLGTADAKLMETLERTVADRSDDPVALSRLAGLYEKNGAADKAVRLYERVLKQNPGNLSATVRLARLYSEQLHDPQKAMQLAKTARGLAPDDAHIAHILGRLAYESGEFQWSLSLLQESDRRLPRQAEVLYDLAWSYCSVGRLSEAESSMRSVLEADPRFPRAEAARRFMRIVSVCLNPEQAPSAAVPVQEVLGSDPNHLPALMASGLIHEQQGEMSAAQQTYERILVRHPLFAPANRRLAMLYARQPGDDSKAYDHALKARDAFPDDPEVARTLGIVSYRRGDYRRSAQMLKESSEKRPQDAEAFFYLGMAHHQLKEENEARGALRQALALSPKADFAAEANRVLAELK